VPEHLRLPQFELSSEISDFEAVWLSFRMGWMESPHYFGGASETARDVAASILNIDTGAPAMILASHGHEKDVQYPQEKQQGGSTAMTVHRQYSEETVLTVYRSQHPPPKVTTITLYTNPMKEWVNLEVYVDEYIVMAQLLTALTYITRAMLHGI
jgi:hypothetical protein